jgi:hypothetical protein
MWQCRPPAMNSLVPEEKWLQLFRNRCTIMSEAAGPPRTVFGNVGLQARTVYNM